MSELDVEYDYTEMALAWLRGDAAINGHTIGEFIASSDTATIKVHVKDGVVSSMSLAKGPTND